MDATCNVQDSIHVFHLVHNMCPGFWVHITINGGCLLVVSSNQNSGRNRDVSQIAPVDLRCIDMKEERRHAQKSLPQCWCEFESFLAMEALFNRKMIREMSNNLLIGIIGLIEVLLNLLTNFLQMAWCWDNLNKATGWGQDPFKFLIVRWRKDV